MMTQNVQKECPLDCWLHHLQQNRSPPRKDTIMRLVGRQNEGKNVLQLDNMKRRWCGKII